MAVSAPGGRGPGRGCGRFQMARPAGPGRRGAGRAARGLRTAGGSLARPGDLRFGAPRLSEDAATSGGGSRRPGMAAWSPAAAAPLLRRIRGVSTGRGQVLAPGREPRRGRGSEQGLPVLSFIHSFLVDSLGGPDYGHSEKCQDPVPWGTPRAGWRSGAGDRHPTVAARGKQRCSVEPPARESQPGGTARVPAWGGVCTVGTSTGLGDLDPHKSHSPRVEPSRGHSPRALLIFSPLSDPSLPGFIRLFPCPPFSPAGLDLPPQQVYW